MEKVQDFNRDRWKLDANHCFLPRRMTYQAGVHPMNPYRMMMRIWKSGSQSLLLKESHSEKEKITATPVVSASFVLMPLGIAFSYHVDTVLHAMHADQGRHIPLLLMAVGCFRGSNITTCWCMGRNTIIFPLLSSTNAIVTLAVQLITFYVLSMHHDMGVLF